MVTSPPPISCTCQDVHTTYNKIEKKKQEKDIEMDDIMKCK